MRLAVPFLLLATSFLPSVTVSSAQTVNPQTGAVCEPQPTDMDAVRSKAETGDASAEYELGRSMLGPKPTDSEVASAMAWFRRSAATAVQIRSDASQRWCMVGKYRGVVSAYAIDDSASITAIGRIIYLHRHRIQCGSSALSLITAQ